VVHGPQYADQLTSMIRGIYPVPHSTLVENVVENIAYNVLPFYRS
jgi:hypothetical protein